MGCTSSRSLDHLTDSTFIDRVREQEAVAKKQQSVDVRAAIKLLWESRNVENDDLEITETRTKYHEMISDLLIDHVDDRNSFLGVEFYLPQLAHMLVHLGLNWDDQIIERFILVIAQQSFHSAINLSWILTGFMEDYQNEDSQGQRNPNANIEYYTHCASLLEKLESAMVYSSPQRKTIEKLYTKGAVSREELIAMEKVDRKIQALQISTAERVRADYEIDGELQYKRWHKRSILHSREWIKRRFSIRQRVLYCLRLGDNRPKRNIHLQDCEVLIPETNTTGKEFYFELKEKDRERTYMLAAKSKEEMDRWTSALRKAIDSPPVGLVEPGSVQEMDSSNLSSLTPSQAARYGFYRSQRDFVRMLTDICEELRWLNRADRQDVLVDKLKKLNIPGCVYFPLCTSTDPWQRIVSTLPDQCHAFSTKERCPCLMSFKLSSICDENGRYTDISNYLHQAFESNEIDFTESDSINDTSSLNETEAKDSTYTRTNDRLKFLNSARIAVGSFYQRKSNSLDDGHSVVTDEEEDDTANDLKKVELPGGVWRDDIDSESFSSGRLSLQDDYSTTMPSTSPDSTLRGTDQIISISSLGNPLPTEYMGLNGTGKLSADSELSVPQENLQPRQSGCFLPALGKYMNIGKDDDETFAARNSKIKAKLRQSQRISVSTRDFVEVLGERKFIGKSNDDLRQEVFVMQLLSFLRDIWLDEGLSLSVNPYCIISTSQSCGIIEVVEDSADFDSIKKKNGMCTIGKYLEQSFGDDPDKLADVRKNFTESMAGYSLACYLLGIKDRHNGNIMLNTKTGHVTHIDFGFVLGMAPGKDKVSGTNFSVERAAFKMTSELVAAMGGGNSDNYVYFNQMIVDGLMVARRHANTMLTLIDIMGYQSNLPCFNQRGGGVQIVLKEFSRRLMLGQSDKQAEKKMRRLSALAAKSSTTILYEKFQQLSNGYAPCT